MNAEIISIGTEILKGQIIDTNANYIAKKFTDLNIDVDYISAIADNHSALIKLIRRAYQRANIIITTGGLGPTEDDITYQAIAEAFGLKLVKNPEAEEHLRTFLNKIKINASQSNLKQTYLPEGANVIINKYGTAPAMILKKNTKIICSLPGVPREMKKLLTENLIPYLKKYYPSPIVKKTMSFRITGLGESSVNELIRDYIYQRSDLSFGIYAHPEDIQVQVTANASTEKKVNGLLKKVSTDLRNILGEYIYAYGTQSLEEVVGTLLKLKKMKVATAESCTGGMLGEIITRIPGSSNYFQGGIISYNSRIKQDLLKVPENIIREYGEVSEPVARYMAKGAKKYCHSDIGIGITGIAGPGGATENKKAGLVFIALAHGKNIHIQEHQLFGNRHIIRLRASLRALNMLRIFLLNYGKQP